MNKATRMPKFCLARLTNWEKNGAYIGISQKRASFVKLCNNTPEKGKFLCQECLERPKGGMYQSRMLHGTLMDEPCEESKIYGSSWYWEQVAKYGPPYDRVWLEAAATAQESAEDRCGHLPSWKVQRPDTIDIEDMPPKKKNTTVQPAEPVKEIKGTLLKRFTPIHTMYQESDTNPEKLVTDSCKLMKTVLEGSAAFTSTAGHVFSVGTDGEPGELLGRIVGGNFVKL